MSEYLITLLYFIFGAAGTAGRVALSTDPALDFGLNRRTVVEVISGGVAGFVLPYFGAGLAGLAGIPAESIVGMPVIIKAGLVFLVAGAGSLSVGEIVARVRK